VNVRIFRHNFVGGKAKIRRRAVALQGFLTKPPAKFDEKTCMNLYVDRFLIIRPFLFCKKILLKPLQITQKRDIITISMCERIVSYDFT
jgi:hypothetical protein